MNTKGVDIALYDSKKKEVSKEDDENAHIAQSNPKVIRYIPWSNDHDFMENLLNLIKKSLMI